MKIAFIKMISACTVLAAGFAAAASVEIIVEPAQKDRIGDGLVQFITQKPDGKFSGESEIGKLKKVMELAKISSEESEKIIASGKLTSPDAKKILLVIKDVKTALANYFRDELRNSPVSEELKDLLK